MQIVAAKTKKDCAKYYQSKAVIDQSITMKMFALNIANAWEESRCKVMP